MQKLRSKPANLSDSDAEKMIINNNFFDIEINKESKGCPHQFEEQKIETDKVIIDRVTGLMWQQSGSSDEMDFEGAKIWIEKLNQKGYAGYYDWRLPTLEEAMSLMACEENKNNLYVAPIFEKKQKAIWTCDLTKDDYDVWSVLFFEGYCFHRRPAGFSYIFVRAVRSIL